MFSPIIPTSGLSGWSYLQRTYDTQIKTFSENAEQSRAITYFAENISEVRTAKDLVSDRRLLEVALGAFGLQDDIDNRFFIQKMLEEGSTNDDAFANRFSDRRYLEFVEAFGLGPGERSDIGTTELTERITSLYTSNSFEVAAGQQDDTMRVALYAQRKLAELAGPPVKPPERIAAEAVSEAVSEFAGSVSDDTEYFERNIGQIQTVDDLLGDTRLLKIALGAFGLDEDYQAIVSFEATTEVPVSPELEKIRQVLVEGSISDIALGSTLEDPGYRNLSRAFGFGFAEDLKSNDFGFGLIINDLYIEQQFEIPEGVEFEGTLTITNGQYVLDDFDTREMSNDAKWFTIMGEPPLRALFEKALNLPSEFGQVDVDQQLLVFKERSRQVFGSDELSIFTDPEMTEDLIQKYIVRSQLDAFSSNTSSASIALALLQS
ncbi:DUF1217 domain-containing protein [uncultured Roseobacter sp.]|uniref:DUF1217 domain-containing protein n=1 Tax=uncultured Roseobacter sp. TaxID=114847 RepID=UPI00261FF86D|nr:DUF1217 domain-containing protein [uncultured Roseobacter sp.]